MKKIIVYLLLTCLLLTCFAGCRQADVTPTDVTPVDTVPIESVDSTPAEQADDTPDEQIAKNPETSNNNKTEGDTATTTADPEAEETKSEHSTLSADEIHGMPTYDKPTFLSEAGLKAWLIQGSGRYEEERTEALQQATNQKFVYYRPKNDLSPFGEFESIGYDQACFIYTYREIAPNKETMPTQIEVFACSHNDYEELYNDAKQSYLDGSGRQCLIYDGIEYYYLDSYLSSVLWQQFGFTHMASIMYGQENLSKIIPLLKLEQVTVDLNSDHVTQ